MKLKPHKKSTIILVVIITIIIALNAFSVFYTQNKAEVKAESIKFGIDYRLVLAIIKIESNFKDDAVSTKGAIGLMQIMPDTAKWIYEQLNFNETFENDFLKDANLNIKLGVWYLNYLLNKFDLIFALASYNAGEGVVKEWLSNGVCEINDIPYLETRNYVKKVMFCYKLYALK